MALQKPNFEDAAFFFVRLCRSHIATTSLDSFVLKALRIPNFDNVVGIIFVKALLTPNFENRVVFFFHKALLKPKS